MKTCKVNLQEIRKGYQLRIKPNGFLIEGKMAMLRLKENGLLKGVLGDYVEDIYRPGIFKRVFVNDLQHGLPYITAQGMMTADPLDTAKVLSIKMTSNLEPMILKHHTILVSCAGSIGNVRLIDKSMDGTVGSQDIIRVIPKSNYGFIYALLSCSTIYSYLQSQLYGSVIPRIEPEIITSIPMPIFTEDFQKEVDTLIQESSNLREEASDSLNKAKEILSSWLDIKFEKHTFQTSNISSKEIWSSLQHRIDPPALINDGVKMMKKVTERMENKTIGEINGKVFRPGIFKRNYVKNGIPYIKGSEIFLTNPFRRCDHLSRTRTPFIDEMSMKEGQILITCAGSVGDIKLITKEYEDKKSIGSQDIIRLESYDDLYTKEYLFVYLQLPFVYDYIQSMKYGSVIERIEPFHVESIPVIKPSREIRNEITSIIHNYMDCTYKAFNAEEKAITMVEEEIEKWNN